MSDELCQEVEDERIAKPYRTKLKALLEDNGMCDDDAEAVTDAIIDLIDSYFFKPGERVTPGGKALYRVDFITVRNSYEERDAWNNEFLVFAVSENEIEQTFRKAASAFLATVEGEKAAADACDWNWGDFMNDVPDKILNAFGIFRVYHHRTQFTNDFGPAKVVVDHDEVLCRQE